MEKRRPSNIIDIPKLIDDSTYERNVEIAERKELNYCPCCGKTILNPKYFINSIWGGSMYPAADKYEYDDAWIMGVGSESRKRLPKEYVMTKDEL